MRIRILGPLITIPCTAPEVRASIPIQTEIQQKHSANATARPQAARAGSTPVRTRKPST